MYIKIYFWSESKEFNFSEKLSLLQDIVKWGMDASFSSLNVYVLNTWQREDGRWRHKRYPRKSRYFEKNTCRDLSPEYLTSLIFVLRLFVSIQMNLLCCRIVTLVT